MSKIQWPPVIEEAPTPPDTVPVDEALANQLVEAFIALVNAQVKGLLNTGGVIEITAGSKLGNLLFSVELGGNPFNQKHLKEATAARWTLLDAALSAQYTGFRFTLTSQTQSGGFSTYSGEDRSDYETHSIKYSPQ